MLSGKVAVVTGGSRGIGKGIALELAQAGATVYITGRNQDSLSEAAADINKHNGREGIDMANLEGNSNVHPLVCDHADDEAVKKAFAYVFDHHPRVDILVNNAYGAVDHLVFGCCSFLTLQDDG